MDWEGPGGDLGILALPLKLVEYFQCKYVQTVTK